MRATLVGVLALAVACGCSSRGAGDGTGGTEGRSSPKTATSPREVVESPAARARFAELRARFAIRPAPARLAALPGLYDEPAVPRAVLRPAVATGFETTDDAHLRALLPPGAKRAVLRSATARLALRANDSVELEDDTTHVAVKFALRGASDAPVEVADGIALYRGALRGADVVHRVHAEGTEDFVVFEGRPANEELAYDVDVSRVAGLRLVSNVLEFLDDSGAPRLRVAPPYVVDALGARREARIALEGCAYDADASAPWGRAMTRAGATSCGVRVTWRDVEYPAMVDPSWVATGSMSETRHDHTATLLGSGQVLLAGGYNGAVMSSAELFDGTSSFAATGSMTTARYGQAATLLGSGKVLIAGGGDPSQLSTAELFDGASSFTATGSMTTARSGCTATLLNSGKVLVAGGVFLSTAELFDGTSSFLTTGSMMAARYLHTATLLSTGKVLVAGGDDGTAGGSLSSAELFDGTSTFAATGSMTVAREHHTATLLNSGKVLIAGGYVLAPRSTAELFDGTSAFAATGSMTTAREHHTATLLGSGKVLVAGGTVGVGPLASAEVFDGASTFVVTGSMAEPRSAHTATLVGSGKVLVAGGYDEIMNSSTVSNAELFASLAGGAVCTLPGDCTSGVCNGNVCCSAACSGACKTCASGTGACVSVTSADDADSCTGANTCDAAGACKAKRGQTCAADSACASGFCADGVCCNSPCPGQCEVCAQALGAIADGTCTILPAGALGSPACAPGACTGSDPICVSCSKDTHCLADHYCAADGSCQPRVAQGGACNLAAGSDCFEAGCRACKPVNVTATLPMDCVDGVCCETACSGTCQACSAADKGSGADGTCGNVAVDTDPNGSCPNPSATQCAPGGVCDGRGACKPFVPAGSACGVTTCTSGVQSGYACDGTGTCATGNVGCAPYACGATSCNTTCTTSTDCAQNAYCDSSSHCVALKAKGSACTAGVECSNGFCADGVCCDGACAGQCQACDVAPNVGSCSIVTDAPHGARTPCTGGGTTCGGTCDGANVACSYPGSTTSCGTSCTDGSQSSDVCDGKGACKTGDPTPCAGGFACDGTSKCRTTCSANGDCVAGYACAASKCTPTGGSKCSDDGLSSITPTGTVSCAAYRCDVSSGTCPKVCTSTDDCSAGNVCDTTHQCVPKAAAAASDAGGCGCRIGGERRGGRGALLLAAAALAVARRRARPAALGPRGVERVTPVRG